MGGRSNSLGCGPDDSLACFLRVVGPAGRETRPGCGSPGWTHGSHSPIRFGRGRIIRWISVDGVVFLGTTGPGGMESVPVERHAVLRDSPRSGIDARLELLRSAQTAELAVSEPCTTLEHLGLELPGECSPDIPVASGPATAPPAPQTQPLCHRGVRSSAHHRCPRGRRLGSLLFLSRGLFPSDPPGNRRSLPEHPHLRHASGTSGAEVASGCRGRGASVRFDARGCVWSRLH